MPSDLEALISSRRLRAEQQAVTKTWISSIIPSEETEELQAFVRSALADSHPQLAAATDESKVIKELQAYGIFDVLDLWKTAELCTLDHHERLLFGQRVPSAPPLLLSSLLARAKLAQDDEPPSAGAGAADTAATDGREDDESGSKGGGQSGGEAEGGSSADNSGVGKEAAEPLEIRLSKLDLNQLAEIDAKAGCFYAVVYLELLVPGAASDEVLSAPGLVPPSPPLRPNAAWYLERIMPVNGKEIAVADSAVRKQGSDLLLTRTYRGTFYEVMDLERFPFDGQALTITLACLNKKDGAFPVNHSVGPDFQHGIDFFGFSMHGAFTLRNFLLVDSHEVSVESVDLQAQPTSKQRHLVRAAVAAAVKHGRRQSTDGGALHAARISTREATRPGATRHGGQSTPMRQMTRRPRTTGVYHKAFPALSIEAYCLRRPGYYISSILMPVGCISSLAFAQFACAPA
jgi:hypothetical protein